MAAAETLGLAVGIEGFRAFMSKMSDMDDAIERTGGNWGGLSGKAKLAATVLAGVGVAALAAVAAAAGAAALALAKIGADSLKMASDFQDSLIVVQLAAKDTGLSVDELGEAALRVGADTSLVGVSASGAADAMTNLFKAGLSGVEVFGDLNGYMAGTAELGGALRGAIDLAAASELDMVAASELAAITLSSFGGDLETAEERAEFVNRALNNLVQTADGSVTSVSELGEALKNVGPTAAAAGFPIEDVNNALGILSSRGIRGAEAGTALKSMLLNITRPIDKVKDELTALGVELFDNEGNMKSMRTIIGDLQGALGGLTQEQRMNSVITLAGSYGQNALNTLLAEGVEGWDDMTDAVNSASTIQEIAAAKTDSLSGKMEAFEGVVETLKIRIGQGLLPIAEDFMEWAAVFVEDNGPRLQEIFEQIAEFIKENLPPVLEFLVSMFSERLPEAIGTVSSFWTDTLQPAIAAVVQFVQETVIPIFETIVGWLQEYIPLAIEIITDVWENNLLPLFQKLQSEFVEKLLPPLQDLFAWLGERIPQAIAQAKEFWDNVLLPALIVVWTFIREKVIPILFDVAAWLITNIPVAIDAVSAWIRNTLIPALTDVWAYIQDNVVPILETVRDWLETNVPKAIEALRQAWEEVLYPALELIWGFIQDNVLPLLTELRDFMEVYLNVVIEKLAILWEERVKPALEAIWDFLKTHFIPYVKELWEELRQKLLPAFEDGKTFLDHLKEALDKVGGAIQSVIGFVHGLTEKLRGISIPDWLTPGSPPPLFYALQDIGSAMAQLSQVELPRLRVGLDLPNMNGLMAATTAVPGMVGGRSVVNYGGATTSNNFNLTTQTMMGQGALAAEFEFMEMNSR